MPHALVIVLPFNNPLALNFLIFVFAEICDGYCFGQWQAKHLNPLDMLFFISDILQLDKRGYVGILYACQNSL